MLKHILLICLFCCLPFSGTAQYAPLESLTKEIRANFGVGKSIYQAPNGLMWFGMKPGGLVYYDGESVVPVPLEGEADFTATEEVFVVGAEVLYLNLKKEVNIFDPSVQEVIGTIKLAEHIPAKERIEHVDYANPHGEPLLWVSLPLLQKNGQAYYRILLSKNHEPFEWVTDGEIPVLGPGAMEPLGEGLIVKSMQQFLIIDPQGNIIQNISPRDYDLSKLREKELASNQKDKLAFLLSEKLQGKTFQRQTLYGFTRQGENWVLDWEETREGYWTNVVRLEIHDSYLYINGGRLGVRKVDEYKKKNYLGEVGRRASTTYLDSFDTYWLGNMDGIGKRNYQAPVFQKYKVKNARMMTEDENGNIYIGNDFSYIKILDPVSDAMYGIPSGNTTSFSVMFHSGTVYSNNSTIKGGKAETLPISEIEPYTLGSLPTIQLIDRNDKLWSAEWWRGGIITTELNPPHAVQEIRIPELHNSQMEFTYFYQRPSDGTIWLGTQGAGLFVYTEKGELIERLTTAEESRIRLQSNIVTCLYEDESGRLWIGHGKGLSCLNPKAESLHHFELNPDEPDFNAVYGILPEGGSEPTPAFLWLSTNRGLYRFDIQTGLAMGFPLHEDLMNTEFSTTSFYKAKNGRMYVGSYRNGVFAFYPEEVMAWYDGVHGTGLPILINHFSKFDADTREVIEPMKVPQNMETILLRHGDRYFDLRFTVADFRKPELNRYTYKLEGYDEKWRTPSRSGNRVHYENLPVGTYTLRMRGGLFLSDLPSNEKQLEVIVLPPWWATWWARSLFAALILGIGYLIYRYQLSRQLDQAETRRLKELDSVKTRLYTNITHEFRTPLTVISGMAEQIEQPEASKKLILRNSKHLLHLVNQMLDLSKLESGKLNLNLIQSNIIAYLQYLSESFHSLAAGKEIELVFYPEMSELVMDYDSEKLQLIVSNLLSNAIKFSPNGSKIVLHIQVEETRGADFLLMRVRDKGVGIAAAKLPHIFDRFYQVDDSSTRQGEGTGIGLSLTRELVHLMGGSIEVESQSGEGSTFFVRLPISRKAPPVTEAVQPLAFPVAIPAAHTPADEVLLAHEDQPQILIIEDNPDVVYYLQSCLKDRYQLLTAENGALGIQKALEHIPDLIISDVMMPEKDGFEVCQTLKQDERSSHIPIILLTAKADIESRLTGLQEGVDAYLAKPFEKRELLVRTDQLIQLRHKLQARYRDLHGPPMIAEEKYQREDGFLHKLKMIIEAHLSDDELSVDQLARELGMSRSQLFRKIKALTNKSIMAFIRSYRLGRAQQLLKNTKLPISEVAYEVGFKNPSHFSTAFLAEYGVQPSSIRK